MTSGLGTFLILCIAGLVALLAIVGLTALVGGYIAFILILFGAYGVWYSERHP